MKRQNRTLNDEYIYKIENPSEKLENWNEYFIKYLTENKPEYFQTFLHYYESILNKKAKQFISQYNLENDRLDDLKQIFVMVLIEELSKYDVNNKIPLLQKVKYPLWKKWHDYVRENCGTVVIDKAGTYNNTRKIARLYFQMEDTTSFDDIVCEISRQTNLTEKTVIELINTAILFKYQNDLTTDDIENIPAEKIESKEERRELIQEAMKVLTPIERKILELSSGIDLDSLEEIDKKTYNQISLLIGMSSSSGVEKKLKRIKKKYQDELIRLEIKLDL